MKEKRRNNRQAVRVLPMPAPTSASPSWRTTRLAALVYAATAPAFIAGLPLVSVNPINLQPNALRLPLFRRQITTPTQPPASDSSDPVKLTAILITVGAVALVAISGLFVWLFFRRRRMEQEAEEQWQVKGKFARTEEQGVHVIVPVALTHAGDYPLPAESNAAVAKVYAESQKSIAEAESVDYGTQRSKSSSRGGPNARSSSVDRRSSQKSKSRQSLVSSVDEAEGPQGKSNRQSYLGLGKPRSDSEDAQSDHSKRSASSTPNPWLSSILPFLAPPSPKQKPSAGEQPSVSSVVNPSHLPNSPHLMKSTNDLPSLPPRNTGGSSSWSPPAPTGTKFLAHLGHDGTDLFSNQDSRVSGRVSVSSDSSSGSPDGNPEDDSNELTLAAGDSVVVLAWREDGWCYGRREAAAAPASNNGKRPRRQTSNRRISLPPSTPTSPTAASNGKGKSPYVGDPALFRQADGGADPLTPSSPALTSASSMSNLAGGRNPVELGWFPIVCIVPPETYVTRERVEDVSVEEARTWMKVQNSGGAPTSGLKLV
ncbi:hypothetical protein DFJ73DRAFT_815476 [Zopfochytrium polystomum]|nr:hypothetical protein DFJ73DRAFT_815476 [Zopfochytrium polystomum]